MKRNGPRMFILIVLGIAVLSYISLAGIKIGDWSFKKVENQVRYGMDLNGGIHASYQAKGFKGSKVTSDDLNKTRDIMRARLDSRNFFDAEVTADTTNKRITVDVPSVKAKAELMEILGRPSVLQFKDPSGKVILTGKDVKSASGEIDPTDGNVVALKLNSSGKDKFAKATSANVGKNISIVIDGKVITSPTVNQAITDGNCQISGGFKTLADAQSLASNISSGALPVKLTIVQSNTVDSVLGKDAKDLTLKGGAVAIILIFIFMLMIYRLPGLVADIALFFFTFVCVDIIALAKITLTLPGIAGVILSIGMAVDANIIIFERLKEELRWGKSLKAAVEAGFSRAWTAILDGHMTTIIAAAVLYLLGSGTIKGFALTLGLGAVMSLFTAIVVTRAMLRSLLTLDSLKNHKLFS